MAKPKHKEREDGSAKPTEIVFLGEGYASAIRSGKYSTLRLANPRYESLCPGDELDAVCKSDPEDKSPERIPLVILSSQTLPLQEHDRVVLATNGFLAWEQAAARLSEIYGREIGPEEKVTNLVYLPQDVFDALPAKVSTLLLILSASQAVRDPRTREVFLPSIFFTHAYQGFGLLSWLGFAELNGIITPADVSRLSQLINADPNIEPSNRRRIFTDPEKMWDILDAQGYAIYERLVLLKPVKKNGLVRPNLVK